MSPSSPPYILVVEDSDEDFATLQRILSTSCAPAIQLKRCVEGDEALDLIYQRDEYADLAQRPRLIMLDLNLPGTNGREVLTQVKQDDQLKKIPIVVFTTSSNPKDIEDCYQCGANSYLIKPMDIAQLKTSICLLVQYWFEVAELPETSVES